MLTTQLTHLLLLPPALQCWLGLLALGLAWRGRRRIAAVLGVLAISSLYLLSTPWGSGVLLRPLEKAVVPVSDADQLAADGWQAIVVLGGGRRLAAPEYDGADTVSLMVLGRLRYAAQLQRASGLPVVLTGGARVPGQVPEAVLMAAVLQSDFGQPVRWLETTATDTRGNARATAALLLPDITHVVLVSDAWHLRRAVSAFEQAGLIVLPAGTGWTPAAAALSLGYRLTPQHEALAMSRRALHEWLGLLRLSLEAKGLDGS